MKKNAVLFTILFLICAALTGCSQNTVYAQGLEAGLSDDIDVDLTELGATLVYAEVYNMLTNPEDYLGQTVKMSGPYYSVFTEETGSYYHYVIIEDAAACCQSGLEFIWNGEHEYPGDYPADNTKIEVEGVFNSYDELGQTYYYLAVDDINVLE